MLIEGSSRNSEIFKTEYFQRHPNTYKTYIKKFVHTLIGIEYESFKSKPPTEINFIVLMILYSKLFKPLKKSEQLRFKSCFAQ